MRDPSSVAVGDTCLGGAMNDAAGGHGFCPQWQKPQFAVRAHHTVVMRITRGSPPRGKAVPLCKKARRSLQRDFRGACVPLFCHSEE